MSMQVTASARIYYSSQMGSLHTLTRQKSSLRICALLSRPAGPLGYHIRACRQRVDPDTLPSSVCIVIPHRADTISETRRGDVRRRVSGSQSASHQATLLG